MHIADVYSKFDLDIVDAEDCYIITKSGQRILDFYSGHGVVSIGHKNKYFTESIENQIRKLVYYSNAVHFSQQEDLAQAIELTSGLQSDYQIFLSNSGAEANENALKAAAFHNGRSKIISFKNGFHGRTSLAVQCTDNMKLRSSLNKGIDVQFLPLNDFEAASAAIDHNISAVIIEGIQGIGGIHTPSGGFLQHLQLLCRNHGCLLIIDEIQSGFGRSGKMFAFQHSEIEPDIFTSAKGMGNGIPVAATFIKPEIKLELGSLGSTFGGNPLACTAATSVCHVIDSENLIKNAQEKGDFIKSELIKMTAIKEVRGRGLMIGLDLYTSSRDVRLNLLTKHKILCGSASSPETIRLLPPLNINKDQCLQFLEALGSILDH